MRGILFCGLTILGLSTGCGPDRGLRYYYTTAVQPPQASAEVAAGARFYLRAVSFEDMQRPAGYSTEEEWQGDIAWVQADYLEGVVEAAEDAELEDRVAPLAADAPPPADGILVEARVQSVVDQWWMREFLWARVVLRFLAPGGAELWRGELDAGNLAPPPQFRNASYAGRLGTAFQNMLPAVMSVIRLGRIDPPMSGD